VGKITAGNLEIEVLDTVKDPAGLIIHKAKVVSGKILQNQKVLLSVSEKRRSKIALNHTATHILQAGLRQIVGDHVKQSGSMVSSNRLRFDFSHFSAVTAEQLNQVEVYVNEKIRENITVGCVEMNQEEAFKTGATALFEEKYGDMVRVVSIGEFSSEFCGGTHAKKTGNIGLFKIVSEASVASGIRRIEAITGETAISNIQKTEEIVAYLVRCLKATPETLIAKTDKIIKEQKFLEKEIEKLKASIAVISAGSDNQDIIEIKGIKVLAQKVDIDNPAALRDLADKFKDKIKSGVVVLGANVGSKVMLVVVVTKDLTDRLHAGKLIKEISKIVGGGGGGKPTMAQAGGKNPEKTDEAVKHIYKLLEALM
jgi:alanyl-tRNA synthetase